MDRFPSELGKLKKLKKLNRNGNALVAGIPIPLADLPEITVLGIARNKIRRAPSRLSLGMPQT